MHIPQQESDLIARPVNQVSASIDYALAPLRTDLVLFVHLAALILFFIGGILNLTDVGQGYGPVVVLGNWRPPELFLYVVLVLHVRPPEGHCSLIRPQVVSKLVHLLVFS